MNIFWMCLCSVGIAYFSDSRLHLSRKVNQLKFITSAEEVKFSGLSAGLRENYWPGFMKLTVMLGMEQKTHLILKSIRVTEILFLFRRFCRIQVWVGPSSPARQ